MDNQTKAYLPAEKGMLHLNIKVSPGASKNEYLDIREGWLRIRIAAVPEDGKANAALCLFLSKTLDCPKNAVTIISGEKSRLKTVCLPIEVLDKLKKLCGS